MKFLLDENISPAFISKGDSQLHDIVSIVELDMCGAEDIDVAKKARDTGRILITQDLDFCRIEYLEMLRDSGLVIIREKQPTIARFCHMLHSLMRLVEQEGIIGKLVIVSHDNIRIRSLNP